MKKSEITLIIVCFILAFSLGFVGCLYLSKNDNKQGEEPSQIGEQTQEEEEQKEEKNIILTEEIEVKQKIGEKGYVGYYADLNNDGVITLEDDGIIYADLAVSVSGYWDDVYNEGGVFSYSKSTQKLKEYVLINDTSNNDPFCTGKGILAKVNNSTGSDRFYVMTLKDVAKDGTNTAETNSVRWYYYYNAGIEGSLPISMQVLLTDNDFGKGKTNTKTMINAWKNEEYGKKTIDVLRTDYVEDIIISDVWILFENIDSNKWFIPSQSEWAAFASNLEIKPSTYKDFGLNWSYLTSSQYDNFDVYQTYFEVGHSDWFSAYNDEPVRLSTTF